MFSLLSGFIVIFFFTLPINHLYAGNDSLPANSPEVIYEEALRNAGDEVRQIYPSVVKELTEKLQWEADFRPKIILTNNQDAFMKIVGKDIIIAFAVPDKNLIVLDTSRVYTKPFSLRSTLKHELCHLVLHHNVKGRLLPRWVDEGVCQWASGGIAELMSDDGGKVLTKATVSHNLISLRELERFPMDDPSLILAYEESKNIIEYIVREYGKKRLLQMLAYLKEGDTINESAEKSLSMSITDLESKWHASLKRKYTWFTYLSNNLYTILFSFAALITLYGFVRLLKKKREYKDEEEETTD